MIARGSILSRNAVLGTNPEEIGSFTDSLITNRLLILDRTVEIFQGLDTWMYLKPDNNYRDGRLGFRITYNNYLGPRHINHMAAGAEKNLAQCSYTG